MSAVRPCNRSERAGRLNKAEQFLAAASLILELADGEDDFTDAYVTMAVHAGIAAADVICCARLGRHSSSGTHSDAVRLLETTVDREISKDLAVLLGMKNVSGYSARSTTSTDRLKAQRAAERIVEAARVAHVAAG